MATKNESVSVQYVSFENHKLPEFKEVKGKDYVYYGDKNLYPNYLLELLSRCSKHNAIVHSKARFVSGGGLESENTSIQTFFDNKFGCDTIEEVFAKNALDYEIFFGYAIGIVCNAKKKVASIQHFDFGKCRVSKCGKNILFCEDWSDDRLVRSEKGVKPYPIFNKDNPAKGLNIIYHKGYSPYFKKLSYPLPSYIGAIPSIETDLEISNFHLNNIKNGYSGGTVFILKNGEPTAEKKKEIEEQLKKKHTGTDKAGGIIVIYANRGEDAAEIKNINPSDLDKQFAQLRDNVTQEIYCGHEITSPILFGIKESGQLGGRNELIEAFELFNNSYVAHRQRIFEKQFNELAELSGVVEPKIKIKRIQPLSLDVTNSAISGVMSMDEIRTSLGLAPLPPKDEKSQALIDTVNMLNPKVAASVLASFTTNELRLLANLPPITGGDVIPQSTVAPSTPPKFQKMTADDEAKIIELFKNIGEPQESFEFNLETFADALTANEKKTLGVLKSNPSATATTIAEALKISAQDAQDALDSLAKKGLISVDEKGLSTISDSGNTAIDSQNIRTIEVRYKYQAKEGADVIPTTRHFCKFLIGEKKLYTREELDNMSQAVGFSVWNYRGGWYHNPDTEDNQPYCRHVWNQVSVIKK